MKKPQKSQKPIQVDIGEKIDNDINFAIDVLNVFKKYPMKDILKKMYSFTTNLSSMKGMVEEMIGTNLHTAFQVKPFPGNPQETIEKLIIETEKDLEKLETDKEIKERLMNFYKSISKILFPK